MFINILKSLFYILGFIPGIIGFRYNPFKKSSLDRLNDRYYYLLKLEANSRYVDSESFEEPPREEFNSFYKCLRKVVKKYSKHEKESFSILFEENPIYRKYNGVPSSFVESKPYVKDNPVISFLLSSKKDCIEEIRKEFSKKGFKRIRIIGCKGFILSASLMRSSLHFRESFPGKLIKILKISKKETCHYCCRSLQDTFYINGYSRAVCSYCATDHPRVTDSNLNKAASLSIDKYAKHLKEEEKINANESKSSS